LRLQAGGKEEYESGQASADRTGGQTPQRLIQFFFLVLSRFSVALLEISSMQREPLTLLDDSRGTGG
jgi:hypothetical protein